MGGKAGKPDATGAAAIEPGGKIIHEVGGTIMGADPKKSVTNQWCQTWDVKNLFVTDGGAFCSNADKNPTLTIMETSDMTTPDSSELPRIDRRSAIKWMLTAAASVAVMDRASLAAEGAATAGVGYGTDPDLVKIYKPGDVWALSFTAAQRRTATALCDVIIP
eukprot:gene49058-66606_t